MARTRIKNTLSDRVFNCINTIVMVVLIFVFVWPLWFILIASISDPTEVSLGHVIIWPAGVTWEGYKTVLEYQPIWTGYWNTIVYTVVGTIVNLIMTVLAAYPLSRKDFVGRRVLLFVFMITAYFGGGLIPTYLVVKGVGLLNSMWSLILPGAIGVMNMLIMRTYLMESIPAGLYEAAEIDGAGPMSYLVSIAMPLSKPCLAVLALYYAIGHWNSYFSAMIYLDDANKMPLQFIIKDILLEVDTAASMASTGTDLVAALNQATLLQYCTIVVATLPMLCIYPFIQKYFVKGVMIGSVKG